MIMTANNNNNNKTESLTSFTSFSFLLQVLIFAGTLSIVAGLASSSSSGTTQKNQKKNWSAVNSTTTQSRILFGSTTRDDQQQLQKITPRNRMTFLSSCLPSSSSLTTATTKNVVASRAEPTLLEKLYRRFTVFRIAFQVFVEYKVAGWKAKKLKRQLGFLDVDDPESDDHPEIVKLWSQVHAKAASRLLQQIKQLAGFWVKVGQYLSTRADVMPPEYLSSLSELQDSMPAKPWEDIMATLTEELGPEVLDNQFESIDPNPLSTASLAQVHRATLKKTTNENNGNQQHQPHEVVLKVQHRGVATLMLQDMDNLRVILNLLAKTDPDLDFGPVIKEYNQEVQKELDFRTEADNMEQVRDLLQRHNVQAIIPKIVPNLVKERVLVMDFCQGFPVRDTHQMDKYGVNRELLLERICAAWAVQMHVGGLFNADPHGANILVSTADKDDPSIPVLLDFGLTKRLDPPIKLAFARLMLASHEGDVDGLIQSFDEMGLKMNRHDPFEDMSAMQRGFGDTVPQTQAREVQKEKSAMAKQRREAQRAEAGLKKGQKLRNPVEAWPSELVFFGRVTNMLRGLCSNLNVSYPYLKTMAMAAKETIKASVPQDEHAIDLIHESARAITTPLQRKLMDAIPQLEQEGHMVGLQISVLQHGEEIVNIAAGTMGVANPRPVTPSTLFNIFSVSKGVLTLGVLRLVQDGKIQSLDDPVSKYWTAFANKPKVTVRHLLSHQAGLANVYPEDATLDTLLDWRTMISFMAEHAEPSHEPGEETQYHALTYAWLVGGLIEAVTGKPYEDLFDNIILPYAGVGRDDKRLDLFLAGISKDVDNQKDLAVLSLDKRAMQQRPTSKSDANQGTVVGSKNDDDHQDEDEEERKKKARKVLAKYRGLQQLMNPSVFNMRKVRESKLPSANGHASAASLAHVFNAVIRPHDSILSSHTIEQARVPHRSLSFESSKSSNNNSNAAMLNDSQASFGLGFQLHEFTLSNGHKVMSIGHAGLGGSVVLAVPEEQVVVALTLNHLSSEAIARQRLLGIIFEELGWEAPSSLPVDVAATKDSKEAVSLES